MEYEYISRVRIESDFNCDTKYNLYDLNYVCGYVHYLSSFKNGTSFHLSNKVKMIWMKKAISNNSQWQTNDRMQSKQHNFGVRDIGPAVRVFANGPGDLGSIPGRVIPKTLKKMELDTTLLNTQHYKVRFKGKVEQSREWSSALPYTLV